MNLSLISLPFSHTGAIRVVILVDEDVVEDEGEQFDL